MLRFFILVVLIFNLHAIENRVSEVYINKSNELKKELKDLIQRKKFDTLSIAMGISRNSDIVKAFSQNDSNLVSFELISKDLKHATSLKNVWFQLITKDGKSLYRSWTDKRGDSLTFRSDISQIIQNKKLTQSISIGKYDMTFNAIVPVYDNRNILLGFFETITHFNSIDRVLQKQGVKSVVLVDKVYRSRITTPFTEKFINNYYVANKDAQEVLMNMLNEKHIDKFIPTIKQDIYYLDQKNKMLVTYYEILDIENKPIGHYLLFFPYDEITMTDTIKLTNKEKMWLKSNNVIRVGGEMDWPPFDFVDEKGNYQGLAKDYLRKIEEKTGLQFDILTGYTWNELLEMGKSKKLDILPVAYFTKNRLNYFKFTKPYMNLEHYIFMQEGYGHDVKRIEDLENKRVAIIKGYATIDTIKEKVPGVKLVYVDSVLDGLRALLLNKADAMIEVFPAVNYAMLNNTITSIKAVCRADLGKVKLHMMVRKDYEVLYNLLQKGIDAISDDERQEIMQKWTGIKSKKDNSFQNLLNKEEKAYLKNSQSVNIISSPDWPPFDFLNKKGEYSGIGNEYFEEVSKITGLKFHHVKAKSWNDAINKIKNADADIFTCAKQTPERDKYLNFTDTYINYPLVIVTRNNAPFIGSIEDLKNKKIALIKNFSTTELLKKEYPSLNVVLVKNTVEALKKVSKGEAFAYVGSLGEVSFVIKEEGLFNLKVAGITKYKFSWGGAVRKELPKELLSIFNKALASISDAKKNEIYNRWVSVKLEEHVDYSLLWKLGGGALIFISIIVFWNRKMAKEIKKRKVIQHKLDEERTFIGSIISSSQDALIVINKKSIVTIWNDSATAIFGYTKEDMTGQSIEKIIPHKFRESHFSGITRVLANGDRKLLGKGAVEIEGIHKDGSIIEIDLALNTFIIDNEVFFSASIRDIHERKELANKVEENRLFLNTLLDSQEQIIITTDGEVLHSCNRAFKEFYGIQTMEEFTKDYDCICDTFDSDSPEGYLQKEVCDLSWIDYIILNPNKTHKAQITWNEKVYTFSVSAAGLALEGEHILSAVFTDITVLQEQEKALKENRLFLNTLLDSQEQVIITTDGSVLHSCNRAFKEFYGIQTMEEFTKDYDCICDTFDSDSPEGYLQKEVCDLSWIDYIILNPNKTHKAQITWNEKVYTFSVTAARLALEGEHILSAVFTDITVLEEQSNVLKELHNKLSDSIEYASLIQHALIPKNNVLDEFFDDYFAIWKPRDVVGGDIYLVEKISEHEVLVMVVDCTGHGVPGAFVTMLVKAIERQITSSIGTKDTLITPGEMLSVFNKSIKHLLQQESDEAISNAGFDAGIVYYNKKEKLVRFAGAVTPLYIVENGELKTIKPDRHSIGYKKSDINYEFTDHSLSIDDNTIVYITTDGYIDQNGGEKGFPFGKKQFKKIIENNFERPLIQQQELFLENLDTYQGNYETNDDITILGLKF